MSTYPWIKPDARCYILDAGINQNFPLNKNPPKNFPEGLTFNYLFYDYFLSFTSSYSTSETSLPPEALALPDAPAEPAPLVALPVALYISALAACHAAFNASTAESIASMS